MADARSFYVPGDGGWVEVGSLPAQRPLWVHAATPDELRNAAHDLGLSDQGLRLLEAHPVFDAVERWADPTHPRLRQDVRPDVRDDSGRHLRARVNRSADGELLLSLPTVAYVEATHDVHTGILTCVITDDIVLTCELGDARVLRRTAEKLCEGLPQPDSGLRQLVAAILLTLVNRAADVETALGDAVAQVERMVFAEGGSDDPLGEVYGLKREIAEARRALGPISTALPEFVAATTEPGAAVRLQRKTSGPAVMWLRQVQERADRVGSHLDSHDALLDAMLSVYLSQVSVRQNEDMRKISAWAAMITVPTLIAGIYGMNFQHMPELTWRIGYPLSLVAMAAVCGVLYRAFRRSGWL